MATHFFNCSDHLFKHYCPTGRRNHGRPLKRLLDTWDRNGSTSGPTQWQIHADDIHLFIPSMKKVSGWLLIHLHTAASTSASDKKNVDLLTSPLILGTTRSLAVPNLVCKKGVEPLWISGFSWRPEFVHCRVDLRCDAKETCFRPDSADALLEWS